MDGKPSSAFTVHPSMVSQRHDMLADNVAGAIVMLRKDTIELQSDHLERLRANMQDPGTFRKVYNFTFDYARTDGQKSMRESTELEVCVSNKVLTVLC